MVIYTNDWVIDKKMMSKMIEIIRQGFFLCVLVKTFVFNYLPRTMNTCVKTYLYNLFYDRHGTPVAAGCHVLPVPGGGAVCIGRAACECTEPALQQ